MLVNKRQLSEILGVSERSLTDWQKEGLPVASYADNRGQANEYESSEVIRWMVQREIERLNKEKPRDRLDRLKADAIELDIKERTGELAPAALFERAWSDHILAARTEFLTMPDILATELSATAGVEIDPDAIAAHIYRALDKLVNYGADDDADSDNNDASADG
ncbi:terminase small subunit [Neisseria sp. 27098_8_139]|uniref:terminase small subunit n=1 Tax=Neisseria sp. 27098_8_139 TaxID=3003681 RepID=UPI00352F830F